MASETETLKKDMADLRTSIDKLTKDVSAISKSMAEETQGEIRDKAQRLAEQARDKGKQSAEAVGTTVSDNPLRSVLIAFGAGVVFSQLIRRH